MDKPQLITYQSRQLDLAQLKRIAGQGTLISVADTQLNVVHTDANHPELVVVAVGADKYDVLLGYARSGTQPARLVSKIVLKKALVDKSAAIQPISVREGAAPASRDGFTRLQERYRNEARDGGFQGGYRDRY